MSKHSDVCGDMPLLCWASLLPTLMADHSFSCGSPSRMPLQQYVIKPAVCQPQTDYGWQANMLSCMQRFGALSSWEGTDMYRQLYWAPSLIHTPASQGSAGGPEVSTQQASEPGSQPWRKVAGAAGIHMGPDHSTKLPEVHAPLTQQRTRQGTEPTVVSGSRSCRPDRGTPVRPQQPWEGTRPQEAPLAAKSEACRCSCSRSQPSTR